MIKSIDHINIVVSDLERSVRFYTEILGFREVRRAELEGVWIEQIVGLRNVRGRVVYLVSPSGEPRIELLCYDSPPGKRLDENSASNTIGLRHIALRTSDIRAAIKKLNDAGIATVSPPTQVPTSVVRHDAGQKVLCYFHDPDGVILELTEYR